MCISARWRSTLFDVGAHRGPDVGLETPSTMYICIEANKMIKRSCIKEKSNLLIQKGFEAQEAASKNGTKKLSVNIVRHLVADGSSSSMLIK